MSLGPMHGMFATIVLLVMISLGSGLLLAAIMVRLGSTDWWWFKKLGPSSLFFFILGVSNYYLVEANKPQGTDHTFEERSTLTAFLLALILTVLILIRRKPRPR